MAAPITPAQLSDLEFLGAYDEYVALSGPRHPEATENCEATAKAVKRRVIEAMMVNWAFGGPIKSSMTPAVSAALGLLVSRSPYGGLVGTAVGAGVSCLGPMYTKWHLSSYAEKDPDCTLECMAGCWKQLHAGQGDARSVRLERLKPSLDSVPNGLRRLLGVAFVSLQSTASLRSLFKGVYTDCLTVSPHLQQRVQGGKDLIHKQRLSEGRAKEDELARLRATVDEQDKVIRQMQEDSAYGTDASADSGLRLGVVEETVARILHDLGPLMSHLRDTSEVDLTVLELQVHAKRVTAVRPVGSNGKPPLRGEGQADHNTA